MKKLIPTFLLMLMTMAVLAASPLQPAKLSCEYIVNPLGIDTKAPRFNWTFSTTERNQQQSAYEIIVSDNLKDIQSTKGNVWSSGKVNSSQSIQVLYAGDALKSFTRYYWRVKVYNQNNIASGWSSIATFETAMLEPNDWKASWISDHSKLPAKDEDYYKDDRMPLFRKTFSSNKKVNSARLYISGLGYYEAYLNGIKISDHVLDPGWTTYRKDVRYVVHDITSLIKKGNNVAGIMLGNGWWNPATFKLFGRWDLRDYQQHGRPCVKAEFHISYTDGSKQIIPTDQSWQTASGPIIFNNVYLGEKYDANLEQKNWNNLHHDASAWTGASMAEGPSGAMHVQMQPAIKITKIVKPIEIIARGKDTFLVNMGQNFAGVAKIKVKGAKGTKISIRYGEGLFKDGSLNVMTTVATQIKKGGIKGGPGAPLTAWQEDNYILNGNGIEEWHPRFTFHGFQYLEITGWPGVPTVNDIEGLRMNADVPQNGSFSCSNEMFNQLSNVIDWTFKSNIFSVQSDCPGREKLGYGADMVVSSEAFLFNYDMANFYGKAVTDYANEQQPDGAMTEIAPHVGIADRGYGGDSGPLGWQLAFLFLQKKLYEFYGDKRLIEQYYPATQKQLVFLQQHAKENLYYWDIGDHEAIDTKADALSASCFYLHHVLLAKEFAKILGKNDDSLQYHRLSEQVKRAISRKFLVPGTGRFDNATQAAQIFALWYQLSPEKEKTMQVLMEEFARHNWHLSTGIFATKMMFDVLRENNKNTIAYRIADQSDFPGWGHMLKNGATTLWETWAFPEAGPSRNHPMFGSINEWFYRSLAGINAGGAGFETIIIKPQPVPSLRWVKAAYQSIRGDIKSEWRNENNVFTLHVIVPANTTAKVYLPYVAGQTVKENNIGIKNIVVENGYAMVEVGSGTFSFSVQ